MSLNLYCTLLTIDFDFVVCDLLGSPQVRHEMNRDNLIEHKLSSDQMVIRFQLPRLTSSNMPRPPYEKERYIYPFCMRFRYDTVSRLTVFPPIDLGYGKCLPIWSNV